MTTPPVPPTRAAEAETMPTPAARLGVAWSRLTPALRVVLPALILWVVWAELHRVDVSGVYAMLGAVDPTLMAAGVALAFAAVGAMGLYDLLAFEPPASAGLSRTRRWLLGATYFGWTNFISLGPLGGPALRLLAYRRFGLGTPAIARGLAGVYLGSACGLVGWLAGAWLPLAWTTPMLLVRVASAGALAAGAAWLASRAFGGALSRTRHAGAMEGLPLVRLGLVGFVEWGLALASFAVVLRATGIAADPTGAARAFFVGQAAGILSMIPGGLGSADAVWIKGLAILGVHTSAGAAGVLAFRAAFYLVPWAASLFVLYLWASTRSKRLRRWQRRLVAGAVMLNAVLLLLSAATPAVRGRLERVAQVVPLGAIEASHLVAAASAAIMLLLTRGLVRGYRGAFTATAALLLASALSHPLKGGDIEEAAASLVLLVLLFGARQAYTRTGRVPVGWETMLAAGIGSLAFFLTAGLASFTAVPYAQDLWTRFSEQAEASRFLRAAALIALVLLAFVLREATRPARARLGVTDDELDLAEAFVRAHADSADALLIGGRDKGVWFHEPTPGRPTGLAVCQRMGDRLFVLKDPVVGPGEDPDAVLGALIGHAESLDLDIVFAMASGPWINRLHDFGFHFLKIGEEAVVDLDGFTLAGGKNASFRRLIRETEKTGVRFEILNPPLDRATVHRLGEVSDAWLAAKNARELQFSACAFSPAYIRRNPVGVARDADGRIIAFVNILATRPGGPVTIDLMRSVPGAVSNVMDYVIINTMRSMAEAGHDSFSLGGAPLSDVGVQRRSRLAERGLRAFSLRAERIYNYHGLRLYKGKFHPRWEPRFMAYQQPWDWTGALIAYARLVESRSKADRRRIAAARRDDGLGG